MANKFLGNFLVTLATSAEIVSVLGEGSTFVIIPVSLICKQE